MELVDMLEENYEIQKEHYYNKYLPYYDKLQSASKIQLSEIKAQLGRAVATRDLTFSANHWTGMLVRYIHLYGYNFSKSDHVHFVQLLFDLTVMPDLEVSLTVKFSSVLCFLLRKKQLLSRDDIVLPWRRLHQLIESILYSSYEEHGLLLYPTNVETVMKKLITCCGRFFSVESTQEMLDEWRPLLCPFDVTIIKGLGYFDNFLVTNLPVEHHEKGFKLWLQEMLDLWDSFHGFPTWESSLMCLFSRLAVDNIGYIDWNPYIPKIFTRILRSLNLPVGSQNMQVRRLHNVYETVTISAWITSMLGGESCAQEHVTKLFQSIQSFYHPSNFGHWNTSLTKLLMELPHAVVKRVHRERYSTFERDVPIPDSAKLTDADITAFVESLKSVVLLAMFSKSDTMDIAMSLKYLAELRPEIVVPPLLESTYPALETLTEPHRLTACLNCVASVALPMLLGKDAYPDGATHVIPLLNLCLPGIDTNDIRKSLVTFQLISTFIALVPLVDSSDALHTRNDLTDTEKELCSATARFEDFILQFMDRVFYLIESNSHTTGSHRDISVQDRINPEQFLLSMALRSTFGTLLHQCSPALSKLTLDRLFRFVSTSMFEWNIGGRFVSGLCRCAAKAQPEAALKRFVPYFCDKIKSIVTSNASINTEEHVDEQLLWYLKLLGELIHTDGSEVLKHSTQIFEVLDMTLSLTCIKAYELSAHILKNILKAWTSTYPTDFCSVTQALDQPSDKYLPIRDWGASGDLDNLNVKWHVPTSEEMDMAQLCLNKYLKTELETVKSVDKKTKINRDVLLRRLTVISECLLGVASAISPLEGTPIQLVSSQVPLKKTRQCCSISERVLTLDGVNVRITILQSIRPLLNHMLEVCEDNTKVLLKIQSVYSLLLLSHGTYKEEFDSRLKKCQILKRTVHSELRESKKQLRVLTLDRIMLQHERRLLNHNVELFTDTHKLLFSDLYALATSRYSGVRKNAQAILQRAFHEYAFSFHCIESDICHGLKADPTIPEHQFKGSLYLILGTPKRCLATKRDWSVLSGIWPILVQAQHSEKPSVLKVIDAILNRICKDLNSIAITTKVSDECISSAQALLRTSQPMPVQGPLTEQELASSLDFEQQCNQERLSIYHELADTLVALINGGTLSWKFSEIGMDLLSFLLRHDTPPPVCIVDLFTQGLIHDTVKVRKLGCGAVSAILKQLKRKHKTRVIDPLKQSECNPNDSDITTSHYPGDRADNQWHHYKLENIPDTAEKWNKMTFIEKTHWGYYTWPKDMPIYLPGEDQPCLDRLPAELPAQEKIIYDAMSDPEFVKTFVDYLSLEDQKGKDKFRLKHTWFFKGLFRNFGDTFLEIWKPHIERLVLEMGHGKSDSFQRAGMEILAGLLRGCKHWPYDKMSKLINWACPLLRKVLLNLTVETANDWVVFFKTVSESRDPRKLYWLLELLMDAPLSEALGSFGNSSRLLALQEALIQQEWRIPELFHRLIDYLQPHLAHPYKNVRTAIGSLLAKIFLFDYTLTEQCGTLSPSRKDFIASIVPKLEILTTTSVSPDTLKASTTPILDASIVDDVISDREHIVGDCGNPYYSEELDSLAESPMLGIEEVIVPSKAFILGDRGNPFYSRELDRLAAIGSAVSSTCGQILEASSSDAESEERKSAVLLCKTVLTWLIHTLINSLTSLTPETFQFLPILCSVESDLANDELRQQCGVALACMAHSYMTPSVIPYAMDAMKKVCYLSSWHARRAVLPYIQVSVFYNFFILQNAGVGPEVKELVLKLLCDEQLEIREAASETLSGLFRCGFIPLDQDIVTHFQRLSRTKLKSKKRVSAGENLPKSEALLKRHAGVLGLSACVQAFPYDVPNIIPNILMILSGHANDPQPIQTTVKKVLSEFRRTHHDNWQEHRQMFTDDQLVVLTDLLVSPSYYA